MLKAVYHILVSNAVIVGAFSTGFDTVNLHGPTMTSSLSSPLELVRVGFLAAGASAFAHSSDSFDGPAPPEPDPPRGSGAS